MKDVKVREERRCYGVGCEGGRRDQEIKCQCFLKVGKGKKINFFLEFFKGVSFVEIFQFGEINFRFLIFKSIR